MSLRRGCIDREAREEVSDLTVKVNKSDIYRNVTTILDEMAAGLMMKRWKLGGWRIVRRLGQLKSSARPKNQELRGPIVELDLNHLNHLDRRLRITGL